MRTLNNMTGALNADAMYIFIIKKQMQNNTTLLLQLYYEWDILLLKYYNLIQVSRDNLLML